MFRTIANTIPAQPDQDARARDLDTMGRVLDGTIYDGLGYDFHEEHSGGTYIPIAKRRPSVRANICRIVVEDSVSMLFGEGRFPAIECPDESTRAALGEIIDESDLLASMALAAMFGSVGSVAIVMRVLEGRVFWQVLRPVYLMPEYDPQAPDTLIRLTERRLVRGDVLRAMGYAIPADLGDTPLWWQRIWDGEAETWFEPQSTADAAAGKPPTPDTARSTTHGMGFCPAVWVRNLPGGTDPDGGCTFRAAVETAIEIDYQLSQAGRGLKYSSEPTLLIKEPAGIDGDIARSAANALVVSEKGDAKLLEIGGTASAAVIEYVNKLRDTALEAIHGNRSSADKLTAAQSGRAIELLYTPLINLTDRLRSSYGRALLRLLRMVTLASGKYPLRAHDQELPRLNAKARLTLRWPPYFPPTVEDKTTEANTLRTLREGGLISQESAVGIVAQTHDIDARDKELARIKADEAEADARAKRQAAQIQDKQSLPA